MTKQHHRKSIAGEDITEATKQAVRLYGSSSVGARVGSSASVLLAIMCGVPVADKSLTAIRSGLVDLGLMAGEVPW